MTFQFSDLVHGARVSGVMPDDVVAVVACNPSGNFAATLVYGSSDGSLYQRITAESLAGLSEPSTVDTNRHAVQCDVVTNYGQLMQPVTDSTA